VSPSPLAANLSWSYQIGLLLLYLFTIAEYGRIVSAYDVKSRHFVTTACTVGFFLVCLSGVHQAVKIFLGGSYV
jgi:hypothetical protein